MALIPLCNPGNALLNSCLINLPTFIILFAPVEILEVRWRIVSHPASQQWHRNGFHCLPVRSGCDLSSTVHSCDSSFRLVSRFFTLQVFILLRNPPGITGTRPKLKVNESFGDLIRLFPLEFYQEKIPMIDSFGSVMTRIEQK